MYCVLVMAVYLLLAPSANAVDHDDLASVAPGEIASAVQSVAKKKRKCGRKKHKNSHMNPCRKAGGGGDPSATPANPPALSPAPRCWIRSPSPTAARSRPLAERLKA